MPDGLSGGLRIVIADFMYAAPVFQQAGTELGDVTQAIGESVAGMGSFWGNDAAGKAFASSYLPAQEAIFSRLGSAAGAVIGVGDGLRQMAANYDMTEYANAFMSEQLAQAESGDVSSILSQTVHRPNLPPLSAPSASAGSSGSTAMPHPDPQAGPPVTPPSAPRPHSVTTPRPDPSPTPDPTPGAPPSTPVSDGPGRWLLGIPWPAADSGNLFEAGDQWTRLGNGIRDIVAPADSQAASIASNNQGKAVDAFESYWQSYGGRRGELASLADACENVATACYRYAEAVNAAKRQIEEAGAEFAAVLIAGTIAAFFSFGATEEAADAIGAALLAGVRTVMSWFSVSEVPAIASDLIATVSQMLAMAMAGGFSTNVTLLAADLVKTAFGEALPPAAEELMEDLKGMGTGVIAGPLGELGGAAAENMSKQLEEIGDGIASGKIKVADPAVAGQFLWLADVVGAGGKAAADLSANAVGQLVVNHELSMQDLSSDFVSSNIAEAIKEMQEEGD
jgi:uncharacterized protein YukE